MARIPRGHTEHFLEELRNEMQLEQCKAAFRRISQESASFHASVVLRLLRNPDSVCRENMLWVLRSFAESVDPALKDKDADVPIHVAIPIQDIDVNLRLPMYAVPLVIIVQHMLKLSVK